LIEELQQRAASFFRLAEYCYYKVGSRCILINLSDNNQWPLPVGALQVIMELANTTVHTHGLIAAEVTNVFQQIKKGYVAFPLSSYLKSLFHSVTNLRISKLYTIYTVFVTNVVFGGGGDSVGVGGGGGMVVVVVVVAMMVLVVTVLLVVLVVAAAVLVVVVMAALFLLLVVVLLMVVVTTVNKSNKMHNSLKIF
jgi:hypothetical protein